MAAFQWDTASALVVALSLSLAIFLPRLLGWLRRYIVLCRLPSPKGGSLIAGSAGSYNFLAKHKWEAEVTAALGTVWWRREYWKQVILRGSSSFAPAVADCVTH